MRFCLNCGNPLGGSPRYCAGCATQVGPEDEPPSAWLPQAAPATSRPVSTPVSPWSFHDPPAEPFLVSPPSVPGTRRIALARQLATLGRRTTLGRRHAALGGQRAPGR
jgi:hypothetical protein